MDRRIVIVIVILLAVVGALTVVGFVIDALRWLLIVAVVVAIIAAVITALRGRSSR